MVELDEAFLFVTAAGDGSCLAVLADADSDVGQVAYEMTLLVKRVGAHLGTAPARRHRRRPPEADGTWQDHERTGGSTTRQDLWCGRTR